MDGETGVESALFIERAADIVIANGKFSQQGFANVLARFTQPGNRRRRPA